MFFQSVSREGGSNLQNWLRVVVKEIIIILPGRIEAKISTSKRFSKFHVFFLKRHVLNPVRQL